MTIDLPPDWIAALARLEAAQRVLVLGATDMGKSSFIRALIGSSAAAVRILDLDPGQKMIGPPGTASLGTPERLERFIFLGDTGAGSFRQLTGAGAALAEGAEPFVVNTTGYVEGPGARLQAMTAAALMPDALVVIGPAPSLELLLAKKEAIRLARSPEARRKLPAARARIRQAAFAEALGDAESFTVPTEVACAPGKPLPWANADRPVCALADDRGEDMSLAVLTCVGERAMTFSGRRPARPVRTVRLGKMWATPAAEGWSLLERLSPASGHG